MSHRSLPRITIPVACTADWNAMRPLEADGRARMCGACDMPVYDGRSMTRGELQGLIEKHEGSLPCLRLRQRPDGTIVTGSCFAPVLRAGRLLWLRVALAAVAFWSGVLSLRAGRWRPEGAPAPTAVAATGPAPEPIVVTVRIDADKPAEPPSPPIKPAKAGKKNTGTIMGKLGLASGRGPYRTLADDPLAGLPDL